MAAEKEKSRTNLPDLASELLKVRGHHTSSEMLIYAAKDRNIICDMIRDKKAELNDSTIDDDTRKFTEDCIVALSGVKDILSARIRSLLSKT